MHFFRNRNRPRSTFDIKVGRFHLLEVTVHLVTHRRDASRRKTLERLKRQKRKNGNGSANGSANNSNETNASVFLDEWDWYNANREDIHGEFLELLEASVLSRVFGKELEAFHKKTNPSVLPPDDPYDVLGEAPGKRKRGRAWSKKQNKKNLLSATTIGAGGGDDEETDKKDKDGPCFAFGETIRLAYKKAAIKDDRSSRTVLFRANKDGAGAVGTSAGAGAGADGKNTNKNTSKNKNKSSSLPETGTFRDRKKLSHKLLVWIGRSESESQSSNNPGGAASAAAGGGNGESGNAPRAVASRWVGDGIYRSEMVPISGLFRRPKELVGLSEDDDDDDV
eukprot:CAMPEP_0201118562 /NCGR_PEP_ID=MMETSP0850-20130426/2770_1 /ASSEMBLY_ACC=CAM_ASM_000622 /TAXON_ID=183588 /ORGANISM="Pseudo-nitzschia fraudulenta, Strain WWA7" /LENGTH=336 /DNA_ID=CAMNT_0047383873 /DNA_START=96 /DNA_END=1106 /DNA_ORIENTATION=+